MLEHVTLWMLEHCDKVDPLEMVYYVTYAIY